MGKGGVAVLLVSKQASSGVGDGYMDTDFLIRIKEHVVCVERGCGAQGVVQGLGAG